MPTPTKGARLGSAPSHERKILANLAASLFEHRSITTTLTKAKRLRPYAERLITHAKKGDIAARRRVVGKISGHNSTNQAIVHELFTVIAPAMAQRPGGYTRITKIGNRKGDNAPMAVIELVMEPYSPKQQVVREATGAAAAAAGSSRAQDDAAPTESAVTAEATAEQSATDQASTEPAETTESAESTETSEDTQK